VRAFGTVTGGVKFDDGVARLAGADTVGSGGLCWATEGVSELAPTVSDAAKPKKAAVAMRLPATASAFALRFLPVTSRI
jgi:hypothetical protein